MQWIPQYKENIQTAIDVFLTEHYVRENITDEERKLREALLFAVNTGNPRRIHPIFAMIVYEEVLGLVADTALPVFIGLEFIHIGLELHGSSLGLHDEMLHEGIRLFGEKYDTPMKILVGDALLSMGMECLTKGGKLNLVDEALHAIDDSGVVRGMTRDTLTDHATITEAEYIALHDEKTSRLLAASFVIGAYFASAAPEILIDQLRRFAVFLGRAYQVKQDLNAYEARLALGNTEHEEHDVIDFLGIDKARALFENLEFELLKMTINFQSSKFADLVPVFIKGEI
ncbi:polyprenyl synthetase family protein [Candidatus Gracilibacteria bacterium]|nr:polyprenyl synthetase family protein [Candidatus Gracilibacteria bacterium]